LANLEAGLSHRSGEDTLRPPSIGPICQPAGCAIPNAKDGRQPIWVGRRWPIGAVIAVLLAAGMPSACIHQVFARDHEMRVINQTSQTWLIRVDAGFRDSDAVNVAEVSPGADGVAVSWFGDQDKPVELLDRECNVVGVFGSDDGRVWRVPGVDGPEAEIVPGGTYDYKWNTPEISPTSSCGGSVQL
jgi:hypothetical protein